MTDPKNIWIIAGRDGYTIGDETYELLHEADNLAREVECIVSVFLFGDDLHDTIRDMQERGLADYVYVFESAQFGAYNPYAYLPVLQAMAQECRPFLILLAATSMGKDLAPRLAHRFGGCLVSKVQQVQFTSDTLLEAVKPLYGDKVHARFRFICPPPYIVTFIPGVVGIEKSKGARIVKIVRRKEIEENIRKAPISYSIIKFVKADPKTIDICEAEFIVAGGRGINGIQGFKALEEFACLINASMGCTRPIVDEDILPLERQIGQTGRIVNPDLFMSCGISGAIQHEMGMKDSKYVISVNTDPQAQVFRISDLKINTDVNKLLPKLIEKIKEYKEHEVDVNG